MKTLYFLQKTIKKIGFASKLFLLIVAILLCFGNHLYAGVKLGYKGGHVKKPGHNARPLGARKSAIITSPTISYSSPQTFTAGQKVTITPATANVSAYGFNNATALAAKCIPNTTNFGILPFGLAIDGSGNFFITQQTEVDEITASGTEAAIATGFNTLGEIALDGAGNIYVVDQGANEVIKLTGRARTKSVIAAGLNSPFGIAVDPAGNAYVSEQTAGDIKKIPAGATIATTYATIATAALNGLALDTQGNLFIADGGNYAVEEIPADGGGMLTVMNASVLNGPSGFVTVDKAGTLFVQTFDGQGDAFLSYKFPGTNGATGNFGGFVANINELAIGPSGGLYAACYGDQNGNSGILPLIPSGGYFLNKNLPQGLNFDSTTGIISGIPLAASPATNYTVTAYQSNDTTAVITPISAVVNITVNSVAGPAISYNSPLSYPVNYAAPSTSPVSSGGQPGALNYMPAASAIGSGFSKPNGIAKDAAGNLYIADRGSNEVKKMTPGGSITVIASGLNKPTGVAVDAAGNVYFADNGNNAVKKIAAGSNTPVLWGSGFKTPLGIAVDIAGNVYVADKGNGEVKKISTTGVTTTIGSSGFTSPTAVAVDGAGDVYVVDSEQGSVQIIPAGGGFPQLVTFGLSNPFGIAVDNAGDIFVATVNDEAVYNIVRGSAIPTMIGQEFFSPQGIMIDSQGNLYIADTGNNEIRLIQPAGGYFLNQALPAGMQFDSSTGIISGTPTVITPTANYIVTAWNPTGNTSTALSLQVTANPLLSGLALSTGQLSPAFAAAVTSYTASVPNTTTSITLTPTTIDANATVTVNGVSVASGSASASLAMAVGANLIAVVVTASDGSTTEIYRLTVTRLSADALLTSIKLTPASTLTVVTGPSYVNYTTSVPNTTNSVTVTATEQDATATIKVNGATTASGAASAPVALAVGSNTINVVSTAQDGVTTKTYTITATRATSNNAGLAGLSISSGALAPAFATATTSYMMSVPSAVSTVTITPTTSDPDATVIVNGTSVASGTASSSFQLAVGINTITTIVTASDNATTKTYTVTVTRVAPDNADLAGLSISSGALTPAFATGTTSYSVSVPSAVAKVTITPTTSDADATVIVNGASVPSGSASSSLQLAVGANTITTIVTASDGVTTKIYTLTVTRGGAASTDALLTSIKLSPVSTLTVVSGPSYVNYTTTVAAPTSSVTVTATEQDPTATLKVNGVTTTPGTASAPITLTTGANVINIVSTAQDGVTTKTYTITATKPASNLSTDALLTSIKLAPASTLTVVNGPSYVNYTTTVAATTNSVTVIATEQDPTATLKVNGITTTPGTASASIPLITGSNTITIVSTAQDGVTTKTYSIIATKPASANLSALKLSTGILSPTFAAATTSYTAAETNATTSITVTPTASDGAATIKINGTAVASGTASAAIPLTVGTNTITAVVTDGAATQTYTVTVTRAKSTDALLTSIKLTPASALTIVTGPSYVNYTTSVPNATTSVKVTATEQDLTATIKVNGIVTASGTASAAIALAVGSNTINIVSTAQDGTTTKTYTITATRAAATGINNPDETLSVTRPANNVTMGNDGVTVHQGISPNGDGINDYLTIDNIANYPNNQILIMDRNGIMVYQTKGYGNSTKLFDGHSNINGKMQLAGTYFYSLDYTVDGVNKHKTGYIILKY